MAILTPILLIYRFLTTKSLLNNFFLINLKIKFSRGFMKKPQIVILPFYKF